MRGSAAGEAEGESEVLSMQAGRVYCIWDVSRSTGDGCQKSFFAQWNGRPLQVLP